MYNLYKYTISLVFLLSTLTSFSANRYWVATSVASWNSTSSWSSTSGGASGSSVPVAGDVVYFNASGLGDCRVDAAANLGGISMSGYTGTIELNGYAFSVSGAIDNTLASGTINGAVAGSTFTINSTAITTFSGTIFSVAVTANSARIFLNGSRFNSTAAITKTGATNDISTGGNTFVGNAVLVNSGSGNFRLGDTSGDSFLANLTLTNKGTDNIYLAYKDGTTAVSGNLIATNEATGGMIYLSKESTATLTIGGNATLNQTSSATYGRIYLGYNGNVTVAGNVIATNGGTGRNSFVSIADESSSTVTVTGNLTATQNGTSDTCYLYISNSGVLNIGGNITATNTGTGSRCNIYFADAGILNVGGDVTATHAATGDRCYLYMAKLTGSRVTITGRTSITNSNTGVTTHRCYLGFAGSVTFGNDLEIINHATCTNSQVYCNNDPTSSNIYNGNITVQSTQTACDGVFFGDLGGSGVLAAGKTISIPGGSANFIGGDLYFRNFTQTGATPQTLVLASTAKHIYNYGSNWGGNISFSAPRIYNRTTTFNGTALFTQRGGTSISSYGGNVFNGVTRHLLTGSGGLILANDMANDYNADVTFEKTGTGVLNPAYNFASTFAGNININTNAPITFGAVNGGVIIDGSSATQSINDLGTSGLPNFRRLTINKTANNITLNIPIEVQTSLTLTKGNIITTATNILTIRDGGTSTVGLDGSFVDGPMKKIGDDDNFTFPVGKNGILGKLQMRNISNYDNTTVFSCEYFPDSVNMATYHNIPVTIHHISKVDLWDLSRVLDPGDNATCNVRLYWADETRSFISDPPTLKVAHFNSGTNYWDDQDGLGSGVDLGAGGYVTSSVPLTNFSPVVIADNDNFNPLPLQLFDFNISLKSAGNLVSWQTATETNNDYFTVERSYDGVNFEKVTVINGAGSSEKTTSYNYLDENASNNVLVYYRLRQTDFDGNNTVSKIKSIKNSNLENKELVFTIYPNPVLTNTDIEIKTENVNKLLITVTDVFGKTLHTMAFFSENLDKIVLSSSKLNLDPGVYIITGSSDNKSVSKKLVVY